MCSCRCRSPQPLRRRRPRDGPIDGLNPLRTGHLDDRIHRGPRTRESSPRVLSSLPRKRSETRLGNCTKDQPVLRKRSERPPGCR
jgi:hypothetical protein